MSTWEMIERGWHCLHRGKGTLGVGTLASIVREGDGRWHCYLGGRAKVVNFATLKEAKAYCEKERVKSSPLES